ncbi:terminal uridylyltransferase Tailor-like [Bradysia coprophila]|uniref:terminal uridylyltransferase Tailor-like n=1 Tax=Bradysia coprophila TaxID=38358 RepID=UPI00187D9709|nr:terminal uridylyltransferase Tailor-like [Bradysia coprophila]XP_037036915.1 terminal uridylyltransferase Tailor-like [Bradysia coprophila]
MADATNPNTSVTKVNSQKNSPKAKNDAPNNKAKKRQQKKRKLPMNDHLQEAVCTALRNCAEGSEIQALTYALQPESDFMACIFQKIFCDINLVLNQRCKKFEIYPFGSSVCGMAFKTSDFDIYVDIKDLPDKSKKTVSRIIFQTIDTMKRTNLFEQTVAIVNAKIPLLKCVHVKTGFQCDFSFTSPMGRYNSQIIREIIFLDQRIHPLIIILKHWMKTRNLLGTGKITSYCLIMMVIFYLQHEKIIRPLAVYQTQVPKFIVDKYWNLAWNNALPNRFNNGSDLMISSLLRGFVDFYKQFDFQRYIICPLYGQTYERATFAQKTPPEFEAYIEYMKSDGASPLNLHHVMCVQDPFALNHNVAASCGSVHRFFSLELRHASDMFKTQLKSGVTSAAFLLRFFTEFAVDPELNKDMSATKSSEFQVRLLPLEFELSVIRRMMMDESRSVPIEPDQVRKRWSALTVLLIRFIFEHLFKLQVNVVDMQNNTDERLKKYQKLNGQKDVSEALELVHWNVSGTEDVYHMKKLTKCTTTTYFVDEATYATNKLQQLSESKKHSVELNCIVSINSTPVDVHILFNETDNTKKNATKCFYQSFTRSIRNHMKAYFLHCQRVSGIVEPASLLESCKEEVKTNTKQTVVDDRAMMDKESDVLLSEGVGQITGEITVQN